MGDGSGSHIRAYGAPLNFNAGGTQHSSAATATHNTLTSTYTWAVNDGGLQ